MIEFKDFSFSYPDSDKILKNINLKIEKGECVLIVGKSGSGKSTLLRCMTDTIFPKGSSEGIKISNFKRSGFVFQNPNMAFLKRSVLNNLVFHAENSGLSSAKIKENLDNSLIRFKKETLLKKDALNISGGEKQLVSLLGEIIADPDIFIFDEPFTELDKGTKEELSEIISKLKKSGKTIVISIHNIKDVLPIFDRVLMLSEGKISFDGTIDEFFISGMEKNFEIKFVKDKKNTSDSEVLNVKNVSFSYKKSEDVIRNISFSVKKGEKVCICGENGCGKSTLLKVILGMLKKSGGDVNIKDAFYVPQDASLIFSEETVKKELSGIKIPENVGIEKIYEKNINDISGGEAQRVALSEAIFSNCEILILDEPFKGMDAELVDLFLEMISNSEKTVIVTSHTSKNAFRYADRVFEMKNKTLLECEVDI